MFLELGHHKQMSISTLWAVSLIVVWGLVAMSLQQPLWAQQHSRDLVAFGAIKGADFTAADAWRLVVSQWLHVKLPHMLLNAFIIAVAGHAAEVRAGIWLTFLVGLAGGTLGQLASVLFLPEGFISGASQASFALCGFCLLTGKRYSIGWWAAAGGLLIGFALDLFVSSQGLPKPGHLAGLATGLIAGGIFHLREVKNASPANTA